ncbi:MAG: hypothetical protein GC181_14875 [Bacteroidetes bacterium]|nr:hypothetical protein [Bacteroidota bacterium]
MKHFRPRLFSLILALLPVLSFAQQKRALIVAIGDYPPETKWRHISSLNDIPLVQSALKIQGFNDFTILKNEQATKKGIVDAIRDLQNRAEKGDVLVLHFSSHGQRIADDNGDELDGYDEAIVTYNAHAFYSETYHGEEHLRDDEIEILIEGLRQKVGKDGDVLMIADACHSGTLSRGDASVVTRGGMPAFEDPKHPVQSNGKEDVGLFQHTTASRGAGDQESPYVLISASQASQINYEYQGAGSLSTAISRVSARVQSQLTYRSFFAEILKEMTVLAPNQIPALEGDIDRELFAGKVVAQQPYYQAYKFRSLDMNITGGFLNGLNNGTVLSVYPSGTTNVEKGGTPIATATIINAEGTWSKAKLSKEITGNPEDYWLFVTKQTFGEITVDLKMKMNNSSLAELVKNELAGFALANWVDKEPELVIEDGGRGMIDLLNANDNSVFAEGVSLTDSASELREILKNYARGNFIKNLDLSSPGINLSFEFIPVRVDNDGEIIDTLTIDQISENGSIVVNENIGVHIKVTNNGTQKAFFSIIDIQPNGIINGIIPDPDPNSGHTPEQFEIAPNQTYVIPNHKVLFGAPFGSEVFKLFASKKPIDFRPILTGEGHRGEMNEMELLFSDACETASRGGKSSTNFSAAVEASTFSLSFIIKAD